MWGWVYRILMLVRLLEKSCLACVAIWPFWLVVQGTMRLESVPERHGGNTCLGTGGYGCIDLER